MNDAVIVFARLPQKGKVKTRLAKTLGEDFALGFYKICAEYVLNECRKISSSQTSIYIFHPDENDVILIKKWAGNDFRFLPQRGNDIGQKMLNAFKEVFNKGVKRAILIGTDIPAISSSIISEAFTLLNQNEVVIGPAEDGGYYLLGMKKIYEFMFEKIEWGSDKVLASTLDILVNNNIKREIVTELIDIDNEENLKKWMSAGHGDEINPVREFVRNFFNSH